MKILLKDARIFDPGSAFHKKKKNILIRDGVIRKIGGKSTQADLVIEGSSLAVTPGWFDMRANFSDPGFEHKEDLISGCEVAQAGGFTGVAILPNTDPPVHSKNEVSYIKQGNSRRLVQLYPIAAITRNLAGEELTEMLDLHHAGAIAFSDGDNPVWHTDILLKSLQYLQKINGLVINKPEDPRLNLFGSMHEGLTSTSLGLKGMPSLSEELTISRDLELLEYAGGRIHFSAISTEKSVDLVRKAKRRKLNVTCDVALTNLLFDETSVSDFDSNFKLNPPLRTKNDIKALIKGLEDGTIDAITSAHSPQDSESKNLEFGLAEFGAIMMQTMLPGMLMISDKVPFETLIEKVTTGPRNVLGLAHPVIEEKAPAELSVFDLNDSWTLDESTNLSKSKNSPLWKRNLKGRVVATLNNKKVYTPNES